MEEVLNNAEIMRLVDHTNLSPTARWEDIEELCDEAIRYQCASVCIPPAHIKEANAYLRGRMPICTVIGFPNGYNCTSVKLFEAKEALGKGADEIDMVINLGWLKEKEYDLLKQEIILMKEVCQDKVLKVIIETCFLTEEEKIRMCAIVSEAGADFIKTSTGFGTGGATFDDIALFKEHVADGVGIKAAGGISSFEDARRFIQLGATRLGTSRLVKILNQQ